MWFLALFLSLPLSLSLVFMQGSVGHKNIVGETEMANRPYFDTRGPDNKRYKELKRDNMCKRPAKSKTPVFVVISKRVPKTQRYAYIVHRTPGPLKGLLNKVTKTAFMTRRVTVKFRWT